MEGKPPFNCYSHEEKDKCKAPNDSIICDEILDIDSLFEITVYRGATLTWQKGRQLASINTGSSLVNFKYNIDGLRTEKKVGTKTYSYIWSSGLLMQQSDGTNTLNFSYAPDGSPLGVLFNGVSYYYIYNLQGDVIGLYNYLGSVVVKYTYDSWGKLISTTGSLADTLGYYNPFRYRGYIYDEETGFYYLKSRYYAPEICRFLNADVLIDNRGVNTQNLFSYCANNPVTYIDSCGTLHVIGSEICAVLSNDEYQFGTTFSLSLTWGDTQGHHSNSTSYVFSTDNDTIGYQKTNSSGYSLGVGSSAGLIITLSDASSIFDLEGYSKSIGGSFIFSGKGIAVDYFEFHPKTNSNVICKGISIIIPLGAEVEMHEYNNYTYTFNYWHTPIKKILESIYNVLKE